MFDFDIVSFIPRAVMQGIPLLYGSEFYQDVVDEIWNMSQWTTKL